jgi:hypothetical protein
MVESGSHLKLLPTSILDTYKVFEHINSLTAMSVLAGEKLVATYSIST